MEPKKSEVRSQRSEGRRVPHNRLSIDLVARMYVDYEQLGSLTRAAAKYGRTGAALFSIFRYRGLPTLKNRWVQVAKTRRSKIDGLVAEMYEEYKAGASLNELGRKYDRDRRSIGELFRKRGFEVRPCAGMGARDPVTGRIIPMKKLTKAEIEALIAKETKLRVPNELKLEWRKWPMARRGAFVAKLRKKLANPGDRPETPFSKNVTPFDYACAQAIEICARMNAGTDSRNARIKLDICSQGVIWRDQLWFWSHKAGYQSCGPWTPERGRPLLHHVMWEEVNGPVPAEHVLRFRDGNRNNLVVENLELVHRRDLVTENSDNRQKLPWPAFYRRHDALLGELQRAIASGEAAAIERAKSAYEALQPPPPRSEESRAKIGAGAKAWWDSLSPEQKRAHGRKIALSVRARKHAARGTALERMVA